MKPYGITQFILNYFRFKLKAKTVHQIHSPFVFNLVNDCLKKRHKGNSEDIELLRNELKKNRQTLEFSDFGSEGQIKRKTIASIAKTSVKHRKLAELIAKICDYFNVNDALELGTSLGLTSAYISRSINGTLYTFEGAEPIAQCALENWSRLNITNIKLHLGPFNKTLEKELNVNAEFDLVFIDGHHQYEPTVLYFKRLLRHCNNDSVLILDDIHWSKGMEKAWSEIKEMTEVRCTLDLYFVGLVFIRKEMSKENYCIKY